MPGFPPTSWGRPRVEIVTVEPTAIQITWVGLGHGPLAITLESPSEPRRRLTVPSHGEPGGLVLEELRPGQEYILTIAGPDVPDRKSRFHLRTPVLPPGAELYRFATVSDVHLGAEHFGLLRTLRERGPVAVPHPLRCGAAAIADARAWGAEMLIIKGDLVEFGTEAEWEAADQLLTNAGLPAVMVPGNHEVKRRRSMDTPPAVAQGTVPIVERVEHRDRPGLRLILVNSSVDRRGHGAVAALSAEVAERAGEAEQPVFVALHHYPQRFELPWFWPPGIPGREARAFLDELAGANPRGFVTSGHTHRNRARRRGPLAITEVGSTKDFPGVWAGYVVYEGGICQTVRRTLAPEAMGWTEYTRRAVAGIWGQWSFGTLSDRCLVHPW